MKLKREDENGWKGGVNKKKDEYEIEVEDRNIQIMVQGMRQLRRGILGI